ncbi:MAG: hypothetical protein LBE70_03630, partial [Nitrososphaerota archaeon]|nr:hypothetical protein [Nitrososphaerota archaeon]
EQQKQQQNDGDNDQYVAKQQQNDTADDVAEENKQEQRRLFWLFTSVIMGIVGIIVFLLTEDMTRPMVLVDRWTIVNAIIFIIELIAIALTFKHENNKDKTVAYTVHYYLQGTKNSVASSKTKFGTIGISVTEYAPNITSYTIVGDGAMSFTITEDASRNVIAFYYALNDENNEILTPEE